MFMNSCGKSVKTVVENFLFIWMMHNLFLVLIVYFEFVVY